MKGIALGGTVAAGVALLLGVTLWLARRPRATAASAHAGSSASSWYDWAHGYPRPRFEPIDLHWSAADGRQPTHVEPGYVIAGIFVGEHRMQVEKSRPCPKWVTPSTCRYLPDADVHYDSDNYVIEIRIHAKHRGGLAFDPKEWETRTNTAEMGMTEHAFTKKNPPPSKLSDFHDGEFGDVRVYEYAQIRYEFDLVGGERRLSGIDLLR